MKKLGILIALVCACMSFAGCEEKEDNLTTKEIAGNYAGTLSAIEYSDDPQRAYATLTRKSSDVVSFEISCESFDIYASPVNLIATFSNGVVRLESESTYSISGSITNNVLTVTFIMSDDTFVFSGKKD